MIHIQENIPLASFTTFKIGGSARYFTTAVSPEEIMSALTYAKAHDLGVFVLGGGSNVLFSDEGFDGLVIKLENKDIAVSDTSITAGSGATLASVIDAAIEHGLAGMELMAGIPGTVGGAVRGNAGAFGVEMRSLVTEVTFLDTKTLEMKTIAREGCEFAYRQSVFKRHPNFLVLSVVLTLRNGDASEIRRVAEETIAKREAKHPQNIACAGSFFMNPTVTDKRLLDEFFHDTGVEARMNVLPAGWIIDHAGLRGKKIGGAQVSVIHPNYIINTGTATAEDILILSSVVKQRVRTQCGIQLKEEVQMVGF